MACVLIERPLYFLDLKPIEQVWDWVKEWVDQRYLMLRDHKLFYDQFRTARP